MSEASTSRPLDPMTFPLWGSRLIEASAGTGKTWTIAALYLRLVLGHGGTNGFERPLMPSEILVMTFTRAATRELSERIRSRLVEAAQLFRGELRELRKGEPDTLLAGLLASHPPGPSRAVAARRLAMAAESMDDAAVHTIDAWCQRMLREHAFDSGCLFDEELVANLQAMQHEAVQDYWRQQVYPLDGQALDLVLSIWRDVHVLAKDVRQLIEQAPSIACREGTLGHLAMGLGESRAVTLATLRSGWSDRVREMKDWLDSQFHAKASAFHKTKLNPRHYDGWLAELGRWAGADSLDSLALTEAARFRLTPEGMRDGLKSPLELPPHFEKFKQLLVALDALPSLATAVRAHAAVAISRRLTELKRQAGTFGFADMLSRLDQALDPEVNGAKAVRLRERILAQYPVALVDEFQDTSPVQSRIFDRLYRIASNDRHTALLLIGDPKQSIYGFRGADIHSYLTVRRDTEGRHYALGTNHRSTHAMVAAANFLFATAEARKGEGAFMFRGETTDPLPFAAVAAHGRTESFVTSAGACPAMTVHFDDRLRDADSSRRTFAARCAERIATLLNDVRAGFDDPGRGFTRLRPAQVAVLVRTGAEAALIRRELRRRRIASVYLSEQESVFESAEARDLLHWLRAVASPLDARLVRAALATRTVDLSIDELLRLAQDDEAFDARSEQMRALHRVWREQGILTMLRRSLHLLQLPARWLGGIDATDGERRLTNLLHLAELLQDASVLQEGEQALVRWFAEQVADPTDANDDEIVRLESDADLVQVITVHKSKGLEYPLVFLPFAAGFRAVDRKTARHLNLTDSEGRRTLHLDLRDEHLAAAERERQREDLRLLYVAITRARHVAWVGLALPKKGNSNSAHELSRSALGYVLAGTDAIEADLLAQALHEWAKPCAHIALVAEAECGEPSVTRLTTDARSSELQVVPPYAGRFDTRWSIGSFSAVVRNIASQPSTAWAVAAAREDESVPLSLPLGLPATAAREPARQVEIAFDLPWHTFPRGATPGNFLHDQLEWLAGEGFDLNASAERQQQLLRRCERQGWGHRRDDALAWLSRIVATPLPAVGSPLERIDALLPEMEFWFPSDGLVSSRVDALCRKHLLGGRDRPTLPEHTWRGMLMGFADLVFEQGGRYWVLDYKSNYLGPTHGDYGTANLETAMAAHRYDVQAAIYLLALHRLLKVRLGAAYEPSQHLGGAVFFFLRGLDGPTNGCCVIAPPLKLLDALDGSLRDAAVGSAA